MATPVILGLVFSAIGGVGGLAALIGQLNKPLRMQAIHDERLQTYGTRLDHLEAWKDSQEARLSTLEAHHGCG